MDLRAFYEASRARITAAIASLIMSNAPLLVTMSLIAMLSTELQEAKEKAQLLSVRQPLIRLAGFLISKDTTCTNHVIRMKLDDIAASIGLRAETVSRCISKLEEQQLITRLGQGKLKVTNRSKLSELYNSKNID